VVLSGRLHAVLQATVGNGLSFDPLSFGQDSRAAPAVDVGGGQIVDAFVVSAVVIVVDEGGNLSFEIARTPGHCGEWPADLRIRESPIAPTIIGMP